MFNVEAYKRLVLRRGYRILKITKAAGQYFIIPLFT